LRNSVFRVFLPILFFATLGLLVMGYHPGFEDDGIYLAAVKSHLNPALYPYDADFFRLQLQASFFDKWVADFVHVSKISIATTELLLQFASIALIVFDCWSIARRLFAEECAHWAGVALVVAMFTLPVAGTALYMVDQHLHPRTVATGILLLAVARILDGKKWQAAALLLLAFLVHPLMAVMGASFCLFLILTTMERMPSWRPTGNASFALFVPLGWIFAPATPAWKHAVEVHTYFFLYRWEWYEWLGALAPLFLFWLLWRIARRRDEKPLARFALAVFLFGCFQQIIAMIVLAIPSLIRLVPMQPMRFLHLIYFFMMLTGGCLLGKYLLKASVWRWVIFLATINGGMYAAQRQAFAGNEHIEFPGQSSSNPEVQTFSWIRENTPTDAYFALDPDYMAVPGEDYYSFRALAERSQLADNIKDTAVVTLVPQLGPVWARQAEAQRGWAHFKLADFVRLKKQFGVDWVMVTYPQPEGLNCHWHNDSLAVCQIP
jgi:hypothetical protein